MGPGDALAHGDGLKVPKLSEDGSNWVLYKSQFVSAVIAKKLCRYLTGTIRAPLPMTAPGVDPDADKHYEVALDEYESGHNSIKMLLFQTLPEPLKLKISSKTLGNECWKIVTDTYDGQGEFVQSEILQKMYNLRCTKDDSRPTLLELQRLNSEYATAGGTLPDDQFKTLILASLPQSYRTVVRSIITNAQINSIPLTSQSLLTHLHAIARDDSTMNSNSEADAGDLADGDARSCCAGGERAARH